jgi:hypothetical protein
MKLRTINDVITNSSNEVFIYRSDANPKKVLQELKKILGPNHGCSGMGGILEVASTPDIREEFDYRESYLGLPAGYLLVNIDYGYLEDLRGWLQENLGEPISDEEEKKLFLPSVTKKNKELLEQLKAITEVTDESMKTFGRWYSSCYDLEVCGGGHPEIPKDKVQLFLDYHEKEYQKIKARADKLIPESDDWCDLQYEMDLQSGVIKGLKKLLDENS